MRRVLVSLATLLAIGAFATVFAIVFRQTPKERTTLIHTAVEAEKSLFEGQRLRIGLRSPEPSVAVVSDVNDEGFTASDGRVFSYRDVFAIVKGTAPFKHGYDWSVLRPLSDAKKVLSPGQTVTVLFKAPNTIVATIVQKDVNNFSTDSGQTIAYNDVFFVSSDISLFERVGRTLVVMPFFILWACIDFASIFGFH